MFSNDELPINEKSRNEMSPAESTIVISGLSPESSAIIIALAGLLLGFTSPSVSHEMKSGLLKLLCSSPLGS